MTALGLVLAISSLAAFGQGPASRTLTVCDDVRDPMTLDPQKEFSEKNHIIIQQMFEGLVRFGPNGEILPALATSWRRRGPLTVRFKLRRGVFFHDGEPFDARSVKFSIERYLSPETNFPALGFIDSIARADEVDPETVDLVTKYPDGLLLNRLAGFVVMVAPKYYASNPAAYLAEHPVGTGPFLLDSWEKGRMLVLRANGRYWDSKRPKSGRLAFRFIPMDRQEDALLSSRVDILTSLAATRTLDVQSNSDTRVIKSPAFYTVAANFNLSRRPLSDKNVRRAINLAVDRKALVRYDIFGNGVPLSTLSLPGEFGHAANLPLYPYDPAEARRILKREGYPKGFDLKVLLKVNAERTGRIIARQLALVGIRLKPVLVEDSRLFDYLRDKSQWDMAFYDCPDPMCHAFFIRSIFLSGASPFSLSPDKGIDDRMERMVKALDPAEQERLSEDLDRYIHDEYLALPTYQRLRTYGLRRGVIFEPYISGMPYFDEDYVGAARG